MLANDPVLAFKTLSPEQMLDAVEQHGVVCDGRFLALNSYENRVYQVGVEEGRPVVVKFYRPERWTDQAILEEHDFTQALAQDELPVIAPLADPQGRTLHTVGPFRFAIYPCRGGRAPELDNSEHLEVLGRFIARIHAHGAGGRYKHRPELTIHSYATQPSQFLLENGFIPVHLESAWSSLIDTLVEQIGFCYQRAGSIEIIRLHGDLHQCNVLWTDVGPHIVDFDDARMGPAIQDLWMFLSGDRSYMNARLEDLLNGYTQFYEFNPVELHLVEALRTLRLIHHAGWLASRWEDPAFPLAFPWFNSMKYWEQQILDLREQSALMDEEPLDWS
ncbi:MAG: serine/threonine protein kinase [bacterium]